MRTFHIMLFSLLFTVAAFPNIASSQDDTTFDVGYEVNRVIVPYSITNQTFNEAKNLVDLYKYYKPEWVQEFLSVEILTYHNGELRKAISKNDELNDSQKENMATADVSSDIKVKINYIPNNNLAVNESKIFDFTFKIDPQIEAEFPGGQDKLEQYLAENIKHKVAASDFVEHNLSAINFTINEEGNVIDAEIFDTSMYQSSEDAKVANLLLETICSMPSWKPAEYADGTKVRQDFVLTAGDHRSCVINLLNLRREMAF